MRLCDFATLRLLETSAPFPNYDSARMDLTWALEDVARTSDDAVVRRRFAERNRVWLVVFLLFFAFVSLLEATTNQRTNTPFDVLVATANFALCAFGLFLVARQRMAAEEHERNDRRVHRGAVRAAPALLAHGRQLGRMGDGAAVPDARAADAGCGARAAAAFLIAASFVMSFVSPMPREQGRWVSWWRGS